MELRVKKTEAGVRHRIISPFDSKGEELAFPSLSFEKYVLSSGESMLELTRVSLVDPYCRQATKKMLIQNSSKKGPKRLA